MNKRQAKKHKKKILQSILESCRKRHVKVIISDKDISKLEGLMDEDEIAAIRLFLS